MANAWAALNVGPRVVEGVTVTAPRDQVTMVDQPITGVRIEASSSHAGALRYEATGLPAGLSLDPATGLISGTPTALGSSTVRRSR